MITFLLHKIHNKRWLNLCLFVGMLLLVAVFSCHPMLINGYGDQLLASGFAEYEKEQDAFPAVFQRNCSYSVEEGMNSSQIFSRLDAYKDKWLEYVDVDALCVQQSLRLPSANATSNLGTGKQVLGIALFRDMDTRIRIVKGEGLAKTDGGDAYPCIISEQVMDDTGLVVGEELTFPYEEDASGTPLTLVVAGIYTPLEEGGMDGQLYVSQESMDAILGSYPYETLSCEERLYLDYTQINSRNVSEYRQYIEEFQKADASFSTNFLEILQNFEKEKASMNTILWGLELPCVVLLVLFLSMVCRQILGAEEGEIAVLRSRGVTRAQTIRFYLLQGLFLSAACLLPGLLLGKILCSGSAFSVWAVAYGALACGVGICLFTLPVWKKSKITIVEQKKQRHDSTKLPFWEKSFLDVILLGVAGYLLFNYNKQQEQLSESILAGDALDPMIVLDASLFIFACGLLFVRLLRYLVILIDRIGKKRWSCAMYASFLQIRRTFHHQSVICIFLIMTLATGIFHTNMARTINTNYEQRIILWLPTMPR